MPQGDRSKRQSFLGPNSSSIFDQSLIGIVGLCGGGSHVAQQLAYIGIGNFRLFDHDRTDHSNLNRMVGASPSDADRTRLKTDVIRDYILHIRPSAKVEVFPTKWQEKHEYLRECTALFGCVDSFVERERLEAYCRRFMVPYFDVGMVVHEFSEGDFYISGQAIASIPGHPCLKCMGFITEQRLAEETQRYGDAGDRPQVIWANGELASIAVGMFVSIVTPWQKCPIFVPFVEYDGNRHILKPSNALSAIQSQDCPHFRGADDLGDALWHVGR